ncbi:MAG TPA: AraC family transcriptional regulator ligand-binding domain-containing protein [Polyangiaceae bacterium LLY-WYZ-15_(1-7)]|nr:AraC family transcriptional regulator [Myxococcales bacterium]HJL03690.1 AraC family transcriptional regulator ligand-binding domain-containing protein [Polyangiaceae bacterium LLY-WYZ-15_(1-7)]HJL23235.1 AraC family transcriptional regulator ligand-binding domain-containing protein [Polyangiaceae bacterium LLY-WYZ-15_(1-7)]HJL35234.1 AraC family transcriptional regulator ligand-binding domain-containing protein [Polyangiaceae bacterium LLY-WYZ-15_(1-7)]HJL44473.1 AraC family transcriptional
MGWVSVLFAKKVIDFAAPSQPDPGAWAGALTASWGVDLAEAGPEQMLVAADFLALLERVAAEVPGGRAIAAQVGASMRCDEYGAFGLAFKTATDLEGSYRRVERYGKVITSVANFRLVRAGGAGFLEVLPEPESRLGHRLVHELALAAALALSREVSTAELRPIAVHLTHPAPHRPSEIEECFGCPVRFGADRDALEVPADLLRLPNRLGDPAVSRFFEGHLDDALSALPLDALARRVRAEIGRSLSEGVPPLADTAARLGMSARTLQRRLAEGGTSFKALVDDARRELADRLLRESAHGLAEVAFLTGFADQSSFGRAFKRWYGTTPAAHRISARR